MIIKIILKVIELKICFPLTFVVLPMCSSLKKEQQISPEIIGTYVHGNVEYTHICIYSLFVVS